MFLTGRIVVNTALVSILIGFSRSYRNLSACIDSVLGYAALGKAFFIDEMEAVRGRLRIPLKVTGDSG